MQEELYRYVTEGKHRALRRKFPEGDGLTAGFAAAHLSPKERMVRRFEAVTRLEEPVFLPGERIPFLRTVTDIPDCFLPEEWEAIRAAHYVHESGHLSNLAPDYGRAIRLGLEALSEGADEYGRREIAALLSLCDRYRDAAAATGRAEIAAVLSRVPRRGATTFYEALVFFRILHYALWLEGNYHVTVGRFDQYMYPYFEHDRAAGILDDAGAAALLEEFFLTFNKDSDLYPGVQQGDNGQSMVLGGVDRAGKPAFNRLSELCLRASGAVRLIDPKINLRVGRDTPIGVYELGSELTRAGLGFPQYSNDDVVIPGLEKLGYRTEDARDYAVAACWEFIIPGVGRDVPNIAALSFPQVVDVCLHRDLPRCATADAFRAAVRAEIGAACDRITAVLHDVWFVPSPLMELLMDGEGRYHNFGIHGTGIATAADSLAAIEQYVYTEKTVSPEALIAAVDSDFAVHGELLPLLRYEAPKMGNDEELPDRAAVFLLDAFACALSGRVNCLGGCYRAGTGSAMYYLRHAREIGASPDGRRAGEPFGANFSPGLFARVRGPLSVMRSFTRADLSATINGGPLTLEFAASMFRGPDSIPKIAALVRSFIDMGGHQLQLNAVSTEEMRDAQRHPERHRHLVVRVWGWSAYFVELDREYQEHVLRRQQYSV